MNDLTNYTSLEEKLEAYLSRACQAEIEGNYPEAEHLFRHALYCEGLGRADIGNTREYVR